MNLGDILAMKAREQGIPTMSVMQKRGRGIRMSSFKNIDCDEGMTTLKADSVDIILTDPPYSSEEFEEAYHILSKHAPRVLRPSGFLVTSAGQYHLPVIMRELSQGLEWFWICSQINRGSKTIIWSRHTMCGFKPILVYQKPPVKPPNKLFIDTVQGTKLKRYPPWEQSIDDSIHFLSSLAEPGAVVLDPFAGSGTTLLAAKLLGMEYIGLRLIRTHIGPPSIDLNSIR